MTVESAFSESGSCLLSHVLYADRGMSVDIPSLFRREVENHPLYYNPVDGTVSNASVSNPQSAYYLFPQHTRSNILLTLPFRW